MSASLSTPVVRKRSPGGSTSAKRVLDMAKVNVALDRRQVGATLDLLSTEQARFRWHALWFHLHRATMYLLVLSALLLFAGVFAVEKLGLVLDEPYLSYSGGGLAMVLVGSFFAAIPLFLINLPYAWKLWRHNRLRRRLHLSPGQKAQIRRAVRKRPLMALLALLGTVAALVLLLGMSGALLTRVEETSIGSRLGDIGIGLSLLCVVLSFPSLWLMARARDRLRELERLRVRLAREGSSGAADSEPAVISAEEYNRIARIETLRTFEQQQRTVRQAARLTTAPLYAIQRSLDVHAAIEQLQGDTRGVVEQVIFDLMSNPRPDNASVLAPSKLLSVPVPDTSLELRYELDEPANRLRIHSLQFATCRVPGTGV